MKGAYEVRRRIHDASPDSTHETQSSLDRLVNALGLTTREYLLVNYDAFPESSPAEVDQVVADAPVIRELLAEFPERLDGLLQRKVQLWTEAAPTSFAPHRQVERLDSKHFRPIVPGVLGKPMTGLYTSTLLLQPNVSMWRRRIERLEGSLFPPPYRTYLISVSDTARIAEIDSAKTWVELVERFPLERDGLLYPDWNTISTQYDGAHLTLPAIIASQGIILVTGNHRIAPTFWDVETTLWLRWAFDEVRITTEE